MELAPLVGLADCIVDVVDTGNTLKANGLYADELIAHISSRMVVNQASMKMKYTAINELLDKVAGACQQSVA
jgi:ATP phosphoribosyltransferase